MNSFRLCLWQLTFGEELPENVVRDKNGEPACSWRFARHAAIMFSGADPIIVDLTVPWDDDRQKRWRETMPKEYCFLDNPATNVMAVVGDGTAFEVGKRFLLCDLPNDLILIVEVQGTGVHWMAPVDLPVTRLEDILSGKDKQISLGTSEDGFIVGFVDGEVWMLSREVPKDRLLKFCSRDSAARNDREELLASFQLARRSIRARTSEVKP